jgi:hypothetical protein
MAPVSEVSKKSGAGRASSPAPPRKSASSPGDENSTPASNIPQVASDKIQKPVAEEKSTESSAGMPLKQRLSGAKRARIVCLVIVLFIGIVCAAALHFGAQPAIEGAAKLGAKAPLKVMIAFGGIVATMGLGLTALRFAKARYAAKAKAA